MAQYDITYGCGCKATKRLFGKEDDRHRKIEFYGTIDCLDCAAKKCKNIYGLTGSDKQVSWAESIINDNQIYIKRLRKSADECLVTYSKVKKTIDDAADSGSLVIEDNSTMTPCEIQEHINTSIQQVKDIRAICDTKEASWWIEHKDELCYGALPHTEPHTIQRITMDLLVQNCQVLDGKGNNA